MGSVTLELAEASVEAASHIADSMQSLQAAAENLKQSTQQSKIVLGDMTTFVDRINSLRATIEVAHPLCQRT